MDVAPTVPKDRLTVGEGLAKLAHQAANDSSPTQPRAPASDRSPDAPISQSSQSFAATLGAPDLSAQIPREQRSLGKRGILARVVIAACLGAAAIWAWQSYGSLARDMIATGALPFGWILARPAQTPDAAQAQAAAPPAIAASAPPAVAASAPPPAQGASQAASQAASMTRPATTAANQPVAVSSDEQIRTMARDLAALRQTVEQLAAGQEKLTREMATLQAVKPQAVKPQADKPVAEKPDKRKPHHVAAPGTGSDAFDPTQNPTAPGVPRPLGSIVLRRASP